jgi:hypothetical protein
VYELAPLPPAVAAQVDALSRWARIDYEAALVFVLSRPWDPDVFNPRLSRFARLRRFGLGRGSILYTPHSATQTIYIDSVAFLQSA